MKFLWKHIWIKKWWNLWRSLLILGVFRWVVVNPVHYHLSSPVFICCGVRLRSEIQQCYFHHPTYFPPGGHLVIHFSLSLGLSNAFCCESSEDQSITILELLLYQLGTGGEQNWKICRSSFLKPLGISDSQGIHSHGKSAGIWQVASDGSHGIPAIRRLHKMLDLIWKKSCWSRFQKSPRLTC